MKTIGILLVAVLLISVGVLSGCTGEEKAWVDTQLKVDGYGVSVNPVWCHDSIKKGGSKILQFYIYSNQAYDFVLTRCDHPSWIDVYCPESFTNYHSGKINTCKEISVTIIVHGWAPADSGSVYIEYDAVYRL